MGDQDTTTPPVLTARATATGAALNVVDLTPPKPLGIDGPTCGYVNIVVAQTEDLLVESWMNEGFPWPPSAEAHHAEAPAIDTACCPTWYKTSQKSYVVDPPTGTRKPFKAWAGTPVPLGRPPSEPEPLVFSASIVRVAGQSILRRSDRAGHVLPDVALGPSEVSIVANRDGRWVIRRGTKWSLVDLDAGRVSDLALPLEADASKGLPEVFRRAGGTVLVGATTLWALGDDGKVVWAQPLSPSARPNPKAPNPLVAH